MENMVNKFMVFSAENKIEFLDLFVSLLDLVHH